MLFRDIPGNKKTKKELIKSVQKGRVSHAHIFSGSSGCPKLALALAFARYLNCEQKTETDSCGSCSSCFKYNKLSHPDLHLTFPILKTKGLKQYNCSPFLDKWREAVLANSYMSLSNWIDSFAKENKTGQQGIIYKDEVVFIQKKLKLKNFEADYRVFLIWMPEKMNPDATNKMLKAFEEPPSGTVFLLVSESSKNLLPTLQSRLQETKIRNFTKEEVVSFFEEKNASVETIKKTKNLNESDLGKVICFFNEELDSFDFLGFMSEWMRLIYKVDVPGLSSWVEKTSVWGRKKQSQFLSYSIKIIRESLLFNFGDHNLLKTNKKERVFISKFSKFIHEKNTVLIVEEVENTIKEINRNANAKVLFFELSLQIIKFLKIKSNILIK